MDPQVSSTYSSIDYSTNYASVVILQPSHQQSAQPGVGLESGHRNPFQVDPPLPNSGAQTKNVGSVQLIPASRLRKFGFPLSK